jgi:integrase
MAKNYNYFRQTFCFNGKQYAAYGKTKAEAIKKAALKEDAMKRGEAGISKNMTVQAWAYVWAETYKKPNVGAKEYKELLSRIKTAVVPHIGNMRLCDVKKTHLQQTVNLRQGMSQSAIDKTYNLITAMFTAAVEEGLAYPAGKLVKPKGYSGHHRSITEYERAVLLKVAETHRAGLLVKLLLYTGLRPAEAAALDWRHVDLKKRVIHVEQSMDYIEKRPKEPKTAAGARDVPIPAALLADLPGGDPFAPVLCQMTNERRHTQTSLRSAWKAVRRAMDIEMGAKVVRGAIVISALAKDFDMYCLRHTYCTDLQAAGVPLNVAKYLMGHTDVSTTANIYTHTTKGMLDEAAEKINRHAEKI